MSLSIFAQQPESDREFKPNGKPIITIFSDFRNSVQDGRSNSAFEISRAYVGYLHHFSRNFSAKVLLDAVKNNRVSTSPSAYTVYVKGAYGEYANDHVQVLFGMIPTFTFNQQEMLWGKRYLQKSFQDLNGYSASDDLGVGVRWKVSPRVSLDAQVLNGEGFQKVQSDSTVKVSAGITYEPLKHVMLRAYADYMKKNEAQVTLSAMVGYFGEHFDVAAEYNYQRSNNMLKQHNMYGVSLWGTYRFAKTLSVFGRYDNLRSNTMSGATQAWNIDRDGQLYIAGVEYIPIRGIAISPNVQIAQSRSPGVKSIAHFLLNFNFSY